MMDEFSADDIAVLAQLATRPKDLVRPSQGKAAARLVEGGLAEFVEEIAPGAMASDHPGIQPWRVTEAGRAFLAALI